MSSIGFVNNQPISNFLHPESPKSFGQKISSIFIPHYDLSNQIQLIKGKFQKDPTYAINAQELSQIKEAFIQSNSAFGSKLLKALTQLPPDEVFKAILTFMKEQEGNAKMHSTVEHFIQLLDVEGLKKMTHLDDQKIKASIQGQTFLKDEAIKNVLEVKGKAIWKELRVEIYYFIHHLIETFITLTGLTEVKGHSRRNAYNAEMGAFEAKSKIDAYLALLGYPSIIFASAFAVLGSAAVAGLVTGIILASSLLMIPVYMRYLRPCPKEYEGFNNLNDKILEKESPPIFKRTDVLRRIQEAFQSGKGVILTANPGIGKTTVVDSLAELIVSKQSEAFLANAQVFSANASKMGEGGGMGSLNFTGIDNTFKKHSKEVVFFFDEIESIFKENQLFGKVSDSLLTFHDKYRQIICATTTEQYNQTIKDKEPAFNRRFVHIEIKPLDRTQLKNALTNYLHFKAPELVKQKGVLSYIIEKASEFNSKTSQVDAATSLLSAAIIKATVLTGGQLEKDVDTLRLNFESLKKKMLHKGSLSFNTEKIQKYQEVMKLLKEKELELAKRQRELDKIKKLEQTCLALDQSTYKLAAEVKNHNPGKTLEWLKKQAYHKILSEFLAQKKIKIGLPTCISKELIDQIIREA